MNDLIKEYRELVKRFNPYDSFIGVAIQESQINEIGQKILTELLKNDY